MKTLVTLEVEQVLTVLVESDDSANLDVIADAVAEAYSNGLLHESAFEEDSYGAVVLDVLKSDASDAKKAEFDRKVNAYVHPRNRFTFDKLLEE